MLELVLGIFLLAHGLLTAGIWLAPAGSDAPFDPAHSWLLGEAKPTAVLFGFLVGGGLVATGVGVLTDASWWPTSAVVAGAGGVLLIVVWFTPWLLLGLAINAAVLVVGVREVTG